MRRITIRPSITFFSLGLLTLALGLVPAQAKTDFSGTWKLNASKSDFGPMPPPDSRTDTITHKDPDIKANVVSTGGPMGDQNYDVVYNTEGKETTNNLGGNEIKSTAKWDGEELVIDTKGSFGGNDFTAKERWSLSSDGKTLTRSSHFSSSMGEADMKVVFDKQ
ncbi:MAG TPA: hypothetical protein VMI94_21920 [Bryobacteraceae bacterium]|nr:hypothetical protein [Bryobacteraceae bacterium]